MRMPGHDLARMAGARALRRAASPQSTMVLLMGAALLAAFVISGFEWYTGRNSLFRLFHWWLEFVQGDDSWKPMRAAHEWFSGERAGSVYQHLLLERHVKFQYPPSSLLIFAVPGWLQATISDRLLNLIGWVSVLVEALATAALGFAATRAWPDIQLRSAVAAMAFVMALTFYPVLWAADVGQIQAWLNAWFALGALCFFLDRKRTAGVLIGAICLVKPQFLLFLPWAMLRRDWPFAGAMGSVLVAGFALSVAVYGWHDHADYLSALAYLSHHGEAFVRNESVNGVMNRLLGNGNALEWNPTAYAPYHPVVYWASVLSGAAFISGALFFRRRERANIGDFLIAGLSLTMASPIAWEHHYGILPAVFVVLSLALARRARRRETLFSAVALLAAFLACDVLLPPIEAWKSGLVSLLQSNVFFGALAALVLLYRLRDDCPPIGTVRAGFGFAVPGLGHALRGRRPGL